MSLIQLKQHMQQVKQSSLFELCRATKINPEVLQSMLQHWVRKGKVCEVNSQEGCGTRCQQCDPLFVQRYRWVG